MRMSCNGCRILRKGCSDNCSIRPCLQWIKNPDSQANATLFLAKFYGRAGLVNLISAGPENLRPAIFRSLLYEACGRIVNPIYGSGGLLWSGSWHLCQAAVEAVLKGAPIMQAPADSAAAVCQSPPLWACNVRHVPRETSSEGSRDRHKVKTRCRFKRSAAKPKQHAKLEANPDSGSDSNLKGGSHVSGLSPPLDPNGETDGDSIFSVETVEASLVSGAAEQFSGKEDELKLELSIGLQPSLFKRADSSANCNRMSGPDGDTCKMEVGLDYPA